MTEKPSELTERPPLPDASLREGLRSLCFTGAVFLRARFTAPFTYESSESNEIAEMLQPAGRRVILFHIFTEGVGRLQLRRNSPEERVEAGDIAIFPFADTHVLGDPDLSRPVPVREMLPPLPWKTLPSIEHGGGGRVLSMICGYLMCDDTPFNPVLGTLPPFLKVRPADGAPLASWVQASVQYAIHATEGRPVPDDPLLQRLPELLFTECLCEWVRGAPPAQAGWLSALTDPVVGRALALLHKAPEHPWTLKELARRSATSRSVLDERFRTLLGRAPMSYLTAFRLQLAGRQLRTTTAGLAEIAEATGYGSEASLSRAFKREVGMSPSQWRQAGS